MPRRAANIMVAPAAYPPVPITNRGDVLARQCADIRPHADTSPPHGAPVLPRPRAIQRMEVEQLVPELGRRQHVALDATARADEQRLDARLERCTSARAIARAG